MKLSEILLQEKKQSVGQKWANDKGPFKKGPFWQDTDIMTEQEYYLGYDSFAVESLTKYLQNNYSESEDYLLHIGYGDDFANALTILNRGLRQDKVLMTLIDLAEDEIVDLSGLKDMSEKIKPADPSQVDPTELNKGIQVEMEHTDSKAKAKVIALQHLAEDPRYYTKLAKAKL